MIVMGMEFEVLRVHTITSTTNVSSSHENMGVIV
jgi:hypothetical protein